MKGFLSQKGFDGPMIRRIVQASMMSPYWAQFERGELTEEETLQGFISLDPEIAEEIRRAYGSVAGMLTVRDYAIPLLESLKAQGLQLYYHSNYSKKAYDECGESLSFMPCMDGGLVSFRVGMTKPDPEMFRLLLEKYQLDPADCLFVDDSPENVEAAQSLGFQGFIFTSKDDLIRLLKEQGIRL